MKHTHPQRGLILADADRGRIREEEGEYNTRPFPVDYKLPKARATTSE